MEHTHHRLYRLRHHRILGGVGSGLAEYMGLSSFAIRLLLLVLVLFAGFGLLLYLALWLIIPLEPVDRANRCHRQKAHSLTRSRDGVIGGVCSGLAKCLGIDRSLIRIIFVVGFLLGGCSVLIYLIMWVLLPLEPLCQHK